MSDLFEHDFKDMHAQLQLSLKEPLFWTRRRFNPLIQLELNLNWAETGLAQTFKASTSTPGRRPRSSNFHTHTAFYISSMIFPTLEGITTFELVNFYLFHA